MSASLCLHSSRHNGNSGSILGHAAAMAVNPACDEVRSLHLQGLHLEQRGHHLLAVLPNNIIII